MQNFYRLGELCRTATASSTLDQDQKLRLINEITVLLLEVELALLTATAKNKAVLAQKTQAAA